MKFRIKSYLYLLAFCSLSGLSGCSEENTPDPVPVEGEPVAVQLDLRVATVRQATTRAAGIIPNGQGAEGFRMELSETPATLVTRNEASENEVEHLWILQYAASGPLEGVLLAKQEILLPELVEGKGRVEATLTFGDDCDLFVVANAPALGNEPMIGNRSGFRTMIYNYTAQDEFPMVGHYRGRVPGILGTGVELERLTAKIELRVNNWTSNEFNIRSAILKSVPTRSYFYDRKVLDEQEDWLTPSVSTDPLENSATFIEVLPFVADNDYYGNPHYIWYMPENRRGTTGNTIEEAQDKWLGNSPTYNIDGKGISYATHIELQIDYNDGSKVIPIIITFFPGESSEHDHMVLNNSFNIFRNCHYDISATFSGINEEDPRVEARSPIADIESHVEYSIGGSSPTVWGSGVTDAQVTVYFPVGDEYIAANPVTVGTGGYSGWQIFESDVPAGYNIGINGQILKVVQTVDGYPTSPKALYKITQGSRPGIPTITFLGTED